MASEAWKAVFGQETEERSQLAGRRRDEEGEMNLTTLWPALVSPAWLFLPAQGEQSGRHRPSLLTKSSLFPEPRLSGRL